jgi:Beta-lactamase enzyme family
MRILSCLFVLGGLMAAACQTLPLIAGKKPETPLEKILAAHVTEFDSILSKPSVYEVQIIYTQIDRDAQQRPHFTSYHWNVDSTHYFYPASMVKMPLSLLSLEKINHLRRDVPALTKDTPYRIDSIRPFQRTYRKDNTAPNSWPTLAHDIRQVFVVSDNQAYNHLFEFLGREYIQRALRAKGYGRTGILRRFYAGRRDNTYSSPISFGQADGSTIWSQNELHDTNQWPNPQKNLKKGKGYINGEDKLVSEPFDFSPQNWFALTDMEKMIRAIMFPDAVPVANRFDLTPEDYRFLHRYMGIFPRECDYPKYEYSEKENYDGFCKFLMYGDSKARQSGNVRIFNKIGEAYGTLTDAAYIVDFEHNTEFILAATILCNPDGVFNDDQYSYETTGFPFLAKLGKAVHAYDIKRKRKVKPDLSALKSLF